MLNKQDVTNGSCSLMAEPNSPTLDKSLQSNFIYHVTLSEL